MASFFDPLIHLAEGIDGDGVFPFQEVEEGRQSGDFALDALLFQGAEEGLDVGAEGCLVHGGQGGDLQVRGQVLRELAEVDGVGLEGLWAEVLLVAVIPWVDLSSGTPKARIIVPKGAIWQGRGCGGSLPKECGRSDGRHSGGLFRKVRDPA